MNTVRFAQIIDLNNPKVNPSDLIISEDCDIVAFRLHPKKYSLEVMNVSKPLMFIGTGDDEVDKVVLPEISDKMKGQTCIIGNINEKTYKVVLPSLIREGHYAILKTPIDMNLAKELNISAIDMGLSPDKVIMNTDIGGLGYGYEYGYSIMEKIRTEGKGDKYLDFPLYSDASSEALKTKEAKSDDFSKSWGGLNERARMIELSACAGAIAAGANIVTVNFPENISILKGLV